MSQAGAALSELESFSYRRESADPAVPPQKRPRTEKAAVDAAELLAEAERELEEARVEVTQVDENSMKRMVLSIEKRINENMQMRMKYPDKPEKFMDAEIELYQELKRLHSLAAAPELFPVFVKTRCVTSLLGLLAHENSDIAMDVADLLHELSDADDADPEDTKALLEHFFEHEAHTLLVDYIQRLDESEEDEATAVHSALGTLEAMLEAMPHAAAAMAQKAGLMKWLLARLKVRAFHANKLYASELLSVLLQQSPQNQTYLGQVDGMLSLLTAASQYKRREPQDLEEAELVENVFDCMASALSQPANQLLFLKAEGIELMILTIKERRYASRGALKALDAALKRNGANCERFVDIRGFKTLFPMLGTAPPPLPVFAKGGGERKAAQKLHDEHCASVLCTLFAQLSGDRRLRLLGKLAEDEMAKLDKLMQLHAKYERLVAEAEAGAAEALQEEGEEDEGEEDEDDKIYLARMEGGAYTLQLVDMCLGYVSAAKHKGMRQRLLQGLYELGGSLHDVWTNIDEHIKAVDEAATDVAEQRQVGEMTAAVQALLQKYQPQQESDAS